MFVGIFLIHITVKFNDIDVFDLDINNFNISNECKLIFWKR